jgi:hypothetical protein
MKRLIILLTIMLLFLSKLCIGQSVHELSNQFVCGMDNWPGDYPPIGNYELPITNDTLRALVVFCNFAPPAGNFDNKDTYSDLIINNYWPGDSAHSQTKPSWADSVICPNTTNIWNNSMTALVKDASLGKFFLIGDVYDQLYIFNHQPSYYGDPSRGMGYLTKELLQGIDSNVNFAQYDKFDPWDLDNDNNRREPDGIVDFIFIVFRFNNAGAIDIEGYTGICSLTGYQGTWGAGGSTDLTLDGKIIKAGVLGSGCLSEQRDPWDYKANIHEFLQHYVYGTVHNEMGFWNLNGGTIANSMDREYIGWNSIGTAYQPTSNSAITLGDYTTSGDYLKISHSGGTLYIENRERKTYHSSIQWHNWKWRTDVPFFPNQRDSGLFVYNNSYNVYHAYGNWDFGKCVGGEYKISNYIFYNQFYPEIPNRNGGVSMMSLVNVPVKDMSCNYIYGYGATRYNLNYIGSPGDTNTCFDVGYNQVLSPWSNPPLTVSNSSDSLCIELVQRNSNGSMDVNVYFTNVAQGTPSKPQYLKVGKDTTGNIFTPHLRWFKNKEPDIYMYNIYRGEVPDHQLEPTSYDYIGSSFDSSYVDDISLYWTTFGSHECDAVVKKYMYVITVLDSTDKESVFSYRDSVEGYFFPCEVDGRPYHSERHFEYSLSQNYPNPFNPTTSISYSIKTDNIVRIVLYDLIGRQVSVLVNDFKTAGEYNYMLDANALKLSSGIYFYRIESGSFIQTRKLLLVK